MLRMFRTFHLATCAGRIAFMTFCKRSLRATESFKKSRQTKILADEYFFSHFTLESKVAKSTHD
jgi:hypothetical protein